MQKNILESMKRKTITKPIGAISSLVYWIPQSFLRRIELLARQGQGKGWGTSTIVAEVDAALSLMPPERTGPVVAIDVGANVGKWTAELIRVKPDSKVLAIEPSSTAFSELRALFRNSLNVSVLKTAVGNSNDTRLLFSDFPGSGLASLSKRNLEHFGIQFGHSEVVDVATLDSIIERHQLRPNLLKIDVEGHEMFVLEGASVLLKSVDVIQFEFGGCNIDTKTFFQDFFYFFQNLGFQLFRLGPRGLSQVNRYTEEDEVFQTTNYFAKKVQHS